MDIGDTFERMVGMLHCHASQFYEWLPFNAGNLADVPASDEARRAWLAERMRRRIAPLADRHRDLIARTYGERGPQVRLIEAFEVSEYGGPLDAAARKRLFPFLPDAGPGAAFQRKEWVDIPEE